jgi:6-phosphogluconolactonase
MTQQPRVTVLNDAQTLATAAARHIAAALSEAAAERGRATLAVSGGRTPAPMFERLAAERVPWDRLDVFQVDERVAPAGHDDRNATGLEAVLGAHARARPERFHWMPVTAADPDAAAERYEQQLAALAGVPAVLDVVHLGIGDDGHTASIFPGSNVPEDVDVAMTGVYQGRRRMTLTLPAINRARAIVWVVAGGAKRAALTAMLAGDPACIASRVRRDSATVFVDRAAAPPGEG